MSAGRHNGAATCWNERAGGECNGCQARGGAGEEKVIRETCWASSVRVTETVTVTQGEKLNGVTETCETRHEVTTERIKCVETREIEKIEGRLHDTDGVKDEHTHTEVVEDNGGELADCLETRCRQLGGLLRERRETLCSLEADLDQVSSVVSSEFEGASAADRCTPSLGGIEAPGTLVGTRFPSVNVPVCVFTSVTKCVPSSALCVTETPCVSGVVASVPGCVLPSTPCMGETPFMSGMVCVKETA